ncbi:hypothetical protein GJ744_002236 [Endocarpon pusillum]|uniref:Uncharacterized protein n=1 Tax=Endocarpon pusillum TaxID=364733 RepID=A0A8H7E030_9EURO|nr:hypothetical protein GJ744_002236 [Endocarpon pusillum]
MASDSTRIVADGNDGTSAGTSTPATPSSMEARQEAEEYALKLSARVKSFDTAPLHSTAYMGYLAKYLRRPFKQPRQNRSVPQYRPKARTFIDRYVIRPDRLPDVSRFTEPTDFTASAIPAANEIVFLRGRPSAEWLNEVGRTYKLDHRFFHSHLAATVSTHVHFYATPTLPSRTAGILKFRIPTIVQVGAPGRDLDVEQLEYARHKCYEHLRKMFRSIQDCTAEPGQSIIRAINIHSGSTLVME